MVVGGWRVGGGVSAGCAFGGQFYALEETWHPDLGEPFGVMRCVICHCEPVSAPAPPPSLGRSPRIRPCRGGGWRGGGSSTPSFNTRPPSWKREAGIPPASRTPGYPPPAPSQRQWGGKGGGGGLKDQASFLLLPLLGDGPPAPSLPPSSPPRPGLAGPRTAGQGAGGRGEGARAWLPYRQLGAAQGVRAACGASRWAGMGEARLCGEGGAPWHGLARFGTVLPGCAPPTHTHPPPPSSRGTAGGSQRGK